MVKVIGSSSSYDISQFPRFSVTVDIVIFSVVSERVHVLLIERGNEPERGKWALPGGFKTPSETLDQAAARELLEETSVRAPRHLRQFRSYGDPGRDPRDNVVTVAYLAAVPALSGVKGGSDAIAAEAQPVTDIVLRRLALAFDHRQIVVDALAQIRDELDRTDVALSFLGASFALSDLRAVHEAILGEPLDPANFRRRIMGLEPPLIEATGKRAASGLNGGRPPELFRRAKSSRREPVGDIGV